MAMKTIILSSFLYILTAPACLQAAGGGIPAGNNKEAGCFAAGTLVAAPGGARPIESLAAGDKVYTYEHGALRGTSIRSVFTGAAQLLVLQAGGKVLNTTAEHPLLTRNGFAPAGKLKPGDEIAFLSGSDQRWAAITATRLLKVETPVYNLEVGQPHTFIAEGFIVHNYFSSSWQQQQRRNELRDQYGTESPSWEMLSVNDKIGTVFVGLILLGIVVWKLGN